MADRYDPRMGDFTPHQKKIINRYYDHRDEIILARLQELVTDLYLADSDAKRKRLWTRVASAMKALKVPPALADHIIAQAKPEVLAQNLRTWLDEAKKKN